jgi:hypothetical protein
MVLLVPTVGGCGIGGFAGTDYQTDAVYQPGVGVNDRSGTVDVLGAVVVTSAVPGRGTLVASLVNKGLEDADTLTSVTGEGIEGQLSEPLVIEPDSLVNLADTGAISISGDDIEAGKFVRLTLVFESGQKSTINTPIVPRDAEYADIEPALPSASPSS